MYHAYSTGNPIVDENASLQISGNIIPQVWYKTITRDSGKPYLTAIVILSDIVYWYKPVEIRDESTGQVVAMRKRFKADLLQRNYQQLAEEFEISKKEATNAVVFLEKLGVIRRVFRTVNLNGIVINNVLYIELMVERLKELTFQHEQGTPVTAQVDRDLPDEVKPDEGIPVPCQSDRVCTEKEGPVSFKKDRVPSEKETVSEKGSTSTRISCSIFSLWALSSVMWERHSRSLTACSCEIAPSTAA